MTPSLSLAQSGSGQGGNRSVPNKEREIHGDDFRVVNSLYLDECTIQYYWILDDDATDCEGYPIRKGLLAHLSED